jgi:hypothetical protein
MPRYNEIRTLAPDYEPLPFYSSDDDGDLADWLRDSSSPAQPDLALLQPVGGAGDNQAEASGGD